MKFVDFGFKDALGEALDSMGFEEATPIQEQAIPIILEGHDLIACAQTGTGKTAAFLLPILHKIYTQQTKGINTLVIVPTRELALQIDQQVEAMAYFLGVSSLAVYGGGEKQEWERQKQALIKGADIVIATPGRLMAHLNMGYCDFKTSKHLVLDEADRMLDMGFFQDILSIINHLAKDRQNLLFSATMPDKIRVLSKRILSEPKSINIAISKPAAGVLQGAYLVHDRDKNQLLDSLLEGKREKYQSILIFSSTKKGVSSIATYLKRRKYDAEGISSDLDQKQREKVLLNFRNKKTQILVATDILARGIDIQDINLVINYDVPGDAEDYVHRIGRTARANTTGVAITLIHKDDIGKFMDIESMIEATVQKMPLPNNIAEGPAYIKPKYSGKKSYGRNKGGGKGRGRSSNKNRRR